MSGSVITTFTDERLLASNLGISFFPSYCFGVAVKVNSIVFETYPRPRRQNFPEISYLGKNRSHLKNQVSPGKLSTSRVYLGKKSVVWPQLLIKGRQGKTPMGLIFAEALLLALNYPFFVVFMGIVWATLNCESAILFPFSRPFNFLWAFLFPVFPTI